MTQKPGPAAPRKRTFLRKLAFALVPWLLVAGLAEAAFRFLGIGAPEVTPPSSSEFTDRELTSPDGRTETYQEGLYVGQQILLNPRGFRDWLYLEENTENAVRIAGLGDSFTFGDGLRQEDTWLRQLEERLRPKVPDGRPLRTLNFGRRGANTAEESEMLENHVLPFRPDVVVLGFTLFNDAETKTYRDTTREKHVRREEDWWWKAARSVQSSSYVVNTIVKRARRTRNLTSMRSHIEGQYDAAAEGWIECRRALVGIAERCKAQGVGLVVVIFPSHHRIPELNDWSNYDFTAQHQRIRQALSGHPEVAVVDMVDHLEDLSGETIWIEGNGHPDLRYASRIAAALEPAVRRLLRW